MPRYANNAVDRIAATVPSVPKLVKYCTISFPEAKPAPTMIPIKALRNFQNPKHFISPILQNIPCLYTSAQRRREADLVLQSLEH